MNYIFKQSRNPIKTAIREQISERKPLQPFPKTEGVATTLNSKLKNANPALNYLFAALFKPKKRQIYFNLEMYT